MIVSTGMYITEEIDEFTEEKMKYVKKSAGNHLFKAKKLCGKLSERENILFQRLVEKLIFLRKYARPDIDRTIALRTTRVRSPDKDD